MRDVCDCESIAWPEIAVIAKAHARGFLEIRPPNTQRKWMAEIKQSKIEQVLNYREQVPRSGWVLENFLCYCNKLLLINKCYWPCFSLMFVFEVCSILRRLEIQYLHPKRILIRHSRLPTRDISSAAIAWGKAPYGVLFGQFSFSMLISSPC